MSVFKTYSNYYDLLYSDKDYSKEIAYIHELIKENGGSSTSSILDLGCGTGRHAFLLEKIGYSIAGVDLSQEMIDVALKNKGSNSAINFYQGDVRYFKIDRAFDVVTSLFHVASYQNSNEDIDNFFETAYRHLNSGGLFIFDFWHGPGVLLDPPVTRIKRMENHDIKVLRLAEPMMHFDKNIVDVCYEIRIKDKTTNEETVLNETHPMRYLFLPEIMQFAKKFKLLNAYRWLSFRKLNDDWTGVVVLQKK